MRNPGRFLYVWGPFLTYCILIFTLSSFSRIPMAEGVPDKWLHFAEYFFFAVLLWRAMGNGSFPSFSGRKILIVLLVGSVFGASEELYQGSVPGRVPSVGDWLADVAGILSMITFMSIRYWRNANQGSS